jgi:hypothetical protein
VLPNFIVIGAAKAGTTALHWYLVEHPDVFMTPVKDPSYFAYGRDEQGRLLWGDPDLHYFRVQSWPEYVRLFAEADGATAIGEASTMYLECPQSAARIRKALPDTRILCCLREPVDRAYSDFQMYLRRKGERLDPARDLTLKAAWVQPQSHWMRIGRYHEQLMRYYDAFPRDQIHVFLFDDLKKNTLGTVQQVYKFLGVDPTFVPDLDTPHNIGGMPANPRLDRILRSRVIRTAVQPWVPQRAANWIRRLQARNMRQAPPLPPELRRRLREHFHTDVRKTAELIGRNLEHWL